MGLLQKTSEPKPPKVEKLTPLHNIEEYPIPAYQFAIEVNNSGSGSVTVALFQSVAGIAVKRDVEPLAVGGVNYHTYEFPRQISYEKITFQAGLTSSTFFWDWMMEGQFAGCVRKRNFTLVQRRPNPGYTGQAGQKIYQEVKRWEFFNAYPVSWKISDLNLDDSQKIVLETLELSFEYFKPANKV